HYVNSGDHIITINNVYGPANNFIKHYLGNKVKVSSTFVLGNEIKDFEDAILPNTKLIYLESPSSAIFSLQDIEAIVKLAQKHNIKTIIDNTLATPIFQQPLTLGVDLEVHSCSKYLGGHSDIISGVIVGKKKDIDEIKLNEAALLGAKMAPFEAWLLLRSLRTFKIRVLAHQSNTSDVLDFLQDHAQVSKIYHPRCCSLAQQEIYNKQMSGYTGLLAFDLKTENIEQIKCFVNSLKYFRIGVGWGGHESLVYAPAISYLKEMDASSFKALNISLATIRLSIGLEDSEDLIADLKHAFECMNKI
ncbi:MAG: trans-sulfuration enzyme family protein, partial [Bacilli bacterium]